jgi:hypothetical protein
MRPPHGWEFESFNLFDEHHLMYAVVPCVAPVALVRVQTLFLVYLIVYMYISSLAPLLIRLSGGPPAPDPYSSAKDLGEDGMHHEK